MAAANAEGKKPMPKLPPGLKKALEAIDAPPGVAEEAISLQPAESGDCLIIFRNPDKMGGGNSGIAVWLPKWPFRMLLSGPPGCGKRNMLLNVIMRLRPAPTKILICHLDPSTTEYDVLKDLCPIEYFTPSNPPNFSNIMKASKDSDEGEGEGENGDEGEGEGENGDEGEDEERDPDERTVVIIDETPTKSLDKKSRESLERLCNYGSTHKNTSIMMCFQNITDISPQIRRAFNQYVLWRQPDTGATALAAHRVGAPPDELSELMSLCTEPHDSIWVDCDQHPDSEWRYRLNATNPIHRVKK